MPSLEKHNVVIDFFQGGDDISAMPARFLAGVAQALMAPEGPFAARATPRFSLFALLALLLAATVAGETMILWHLRHPVLRQIALVEARHVAEQRAVSFADTEEVERIQAATYRRLTAPSGAAAKTAAVLLSGLVLPAAVVLTWLALLVLAQFFGGEERRLPDRPRASVHLVATAFVPLALRRLLAGGVTLAGDPLAAANVTTVAAYREHAIARFDLAALAPWEPPAFVERGASLLTDPFGLWALAVLAAGSAALLRLPAPRALALTAVIALLWTLFDTVAGGRWALLA